MTILITGATGFLGSYLVKYFVNHKYDVIALKRSTSDTYRIDSYLNKISFYNADKTALSTIFKDNKVDIVIHTVTDYGRKNVSVTSLVNTNLMFGLELLETSIATNVKAFINTDTLLQRDINAYALSKAQFVEWMKFFSDKNTKMINIKLEHMYGLLDDENKFIYWLINQLKQNQEKIDLTSGEQKRDFIYIDDIISAYNLIIENIESFEGFEEIELGSGNSISVKEFVEKIYEKLSESQGLKTELKFGAIDYRENESMNMVANISKLEKLGWRAKVSIDEGIQKIIYGESE